MFIIGVLWLIESLEAKALKAFTLEVTSKDAMKMQPKIEDFLRRKRAKFDLRAASPEEVSYERPHRDADRRAVIGYSGSRRGGRHGRELAPGETAHGLTG